jgi:hypothetical protein
MGAHQDMAGMGSQGMTGALFARAERVENDELTPTETLAGGPVFTVGKVSAGAIHDWPIASHLKAGLGALYAWNFVPQALAPLYGQADPRGAMVFARLKVD